MPGKTATLALCLTEETPARLRALVRSRTTPAHHVKRSPIILHLVDQHDATEIAAKLRIDRQWVTCFQRRVRAVGPVKAIDDLPRSGRQPDITKAARTWLIGATCVNARSAAIHMNCGRCAYWQRTHARGPAAGHTCHAELAPSTVYEVLNSQPVKPHNVRNDLERRDPAFEEREPKVLEVHAAAETLRQIPEGRPPDCRALLR